MIPSGLLIETADGVRTLALNRPEKLNAWTGRMEAELRTAVLDGEADPTVCAIWRCADEEMVASFDSEDFREGVAHFLEKRPPASAVPSASWYLQQKRHPMPTQNTCRLLSLTERDTSK